jgi:uncharacterized protein
MRMNQSDMGLAVITGASSGIGAVYADRLARRGYDLLLIARNQKRLHELAERLTRETKSKTYVLAADLTEPREVDELEQILRNETRVTLLVNNAGFGAPKSLLDANIKDLRQMIVLNVEVPMRLSYAAVPAFVGRGSGAIINVASIAAVAPEILNGVYGGTKAFLMAFGKSLQHEFGNSGLRVQVVLPGATATNFWKTTGTSAEHLPREIVMPVGDMVDAALAGFDQGELITVPSLPNVAQWDAYESARQVLLPNLSRSVAADRYRVGRDCCRDLVISPEEKIHFDRLHNSFQ